jgi:excisionase family DNA binding protein
MTVEPLLLRISEAAEMLGISRSKAYEMIKAGELPHVRIRHTLRVPLGSLRRWIEAKEEAAQAGEPGAANESVQGGSRYALW